MYSHKSKIICSQDPPPLAPAPSRPQPGCGPAPSSSDAHSVTLDILHWSLLDFSYPLTSCTSDWAAMGGDLEVLNWLRRPVLPVPMCEVAPRLVTRRRHAHGVARHICERTVYEYTSAKDDTSGCPTRHQT